MANDRTVLKYANIILIILIIFAWAHFPAYSQKIVSDVKVTLERLPLEKQEQLKNFADEIETYLNDWDWTGEQSDEEIRVSIQMYLFDNSVSYEARYTAQFLVTNNMDIQYYDKYWKFPYQFGERLEHREGVYYPFTGVIDFYINLILGGEFDKYGKFMGTPYFERARLLSDQAKFSTAFIIGWDKREELIDKIMGDEYKSYREMKDLFFLGLSYVGEQDSTARKYCGQAFDIIDRFLDREPDNKEMLQFLQAHHTEYIDLFGRTPDIINRLIRMDPEHEEDYNRYIEK